MRDPGNEVGEEKRFREIEREMAEKIREEREKRI